MSGVGGVGLGDRGSRPVIGVEFVFVLGSLGSSGVTLEPGVVDMGCQWVGGCKVVVAFERGGRDGRCVVSCLA